MNVALAASKIGVIYKLANSYRCNMFTIQYTWSISRKKKNALIHALNGNIDKIITINGHKYEMIGVNSLGNCFYDAMEVAVAYHNMFMRAAGIKHTIFKRMEELHSAKAA